MGVTNNSNKNKSDLYKEDFLNDNNINKELKLLLQKSFKDEIKKDEEIDKIYNLNKSKEDFEDLNKYQEEYKHFYTIKNLFQLAPGFNKVLKYCYPYINIFKDRDNISEYNYAKEVRRQFSYFVVFNMFQSSIKIGLFYAFMRAVKHKGSKDFYYMLLVSLLLTSNSFESNSHAFLTKITYPLSQKDIQRRKNFVNEFIFTLNRSFVLLEEIRSLSYFIDKDKRFTYTFITPTTGSKIDIMLQNGKKYLSCDNFSILFGSDYYGNNKKNKPKLEFLNIFNSREKDIILCFLKVYNKLIEEYCAKYNILHYEEINSRTKLLQDMIDKGEITKDKLDHIQEINKSGTREFQGKFDDIQFDKLKF